MLPSLFLSQKEIVGRSIGQRTLHFSYFQHFGRYKSNDKDNGATQQRVYPIILWLDRILLANQGPVCQNIDTTNKGVNNTHILTEFIDTMVFNGKVLPSL